MTTTDLMEKGSLLESSLRGMHPTDINELCAQYADLPVQNFFGDAAFLLLRASPAYTLLVRSNDNRGFGWKKVPTWRCRFVAPEWFEVEDPNISHAIVFAFLKYHLFPRPELPPVESQPTSEADGDGFGPKFKTDSELLDKLIMQGILAQHLVTESDR